jgi:RNA polymerase sigma-70 factor, ECF subfamily
VNAAAADRGVTFESLVVAYWQRLYIYALHRLRSHEDAEEAVQDAFLRAYRDLGKRDADSRQSTCTSGWFFKITLNVIRNRVRRKRLAQIAFDELQHRSSSNGELDECSRPDALVDRDATFDLVERAICDLPLPLLETARLRFMEDLTPTQIAQRCSRPVGTIRSHVFRARRQLRDALQPLLHPSYR